MTAFNPLTQLSKNTLFKKGDVFILFGELFGKGYANGLVDQARSAGMKILGITVGRRDKDLQLRQLNNEELVESESNLGGKIINIPLEAGFDFDASEGKPSVSEMLGQVTIDNWATFSLDFKAIEECRKIGQKRFLSNLTKVIVLITKEIPSDSNVFFAHIMAGGVIRSKQMMVVANRVFKGKGKRYLPSRGFASEHTDIGKVTSMNFDEVTANTFQCLLDATESLRQRISAQGGEVRYSAYGYHGTEVLYQDEYLWQTYTSYKQGKAKKLLETIAENVWNQGVKATVFNCPEILTNSSTIFSGVELSLYPFLKALKKENGEKWSKMYFETCGKKLKEGQSLDERLTFISNYLNNPVVEPFRNFKSWPMDHTRELAELMLATSEQMVASHINRKDLITQYLSTLILKGTGSLIFKELADPRGPVLWLGHKLIAQELYQIDNEK